ncbi:MAG: hypothetical protein KIT84_12430 [Labilithrix sp.]|nr:hypothetical protein [Labilithrix sp.]MCW5811820.1 hypothetical protein [Labilithrix sp.]
MSALRVVVGVLVVVCAACTGGGPYSLGEDRAARSDASAEPPRDAAADTAISPASIRCGERGEPCAADEFCDFADTACGTTPVVGRCLPRPAAAVCPAECNPVCGCDGVTYCNECFAHVAGFDRKLPCP